MILKVIVMDMVKVDVEGSEWPFLRQFIYSSAPRQIKQFSTELHTPVFKGTNMTVKDYAAIFNDVARLRDKYGYQLY